MPNFKKYIITSLVLCSIGAVSALLIGSVNLLTKDQIELNEKESQEKALKDVFKTATSFSAQNKDFSIDSSYLVYYCVAYNNDNELGYVYFANGKNVYGEISLMVGITSNGIGNISIVSNLESYASTLEEKYITPYQNGSGSLDDVKCGATYGAKLIKSMAEEALMDFNTKKGVN